MTELTCDGNFVELPVPLIVSLSRDIVAQSNGTEGDKAEVEGLQEVPFLLKDREDDGRDNEKESDRDDCQHYRVGRSHPGVAQCPVLLGIFHWTSCGENHDPLHHRSEEEEGEGDPNHRIQDAKCLASIRQRNCVPIACKQTELVI